MTPDRWQKIEALFHEALERAPEARDSFLANACADDEDLRQEVLLAHDEGGSNFIESPAIQLAGRQLARKVEGDSDTAQNRRSSAGSLPPGSCLGNFRVVEKIGEGGMGDVYLADDLKLGRRVALKLLPIGLISDAGAAHKTLREARAASAINHPHIVTIHSVEEAGGRTFIVMEHIEGESLRDRLQGGPLPLGDVISMGTQLADAIGAAHAINVVHRDLKPGNVLLTADGQAKIVDFGLARVSGATRAAVASSTEQPRGTSPELSLSLSNGVSLAGTVPYMSPEQTKGEHLDARSDIFSLGCVL